MTTIEIKAEPTDRDLRLFAALWAVFFPVLGWIAGGAGPGLLMLAIVAAVCAAVAGALNTEYPLRERLVGAAVPAAAAGLWLASRLLRASDLGPEGAAGVLLGAGVVVGLAGGAAVLASRGAGRRIYRAWMLAVLPIGWTMSHLLLGVVYYLVITPIGLAMRAAGRDPMQRRLDREAPSYWAERPREQPARRYLRQF